MASKCAACGKFISPVGVAACTSCTDLFHKVCVAIPERGNVPKNWVCPNCKKKIPKGDNTDTPVKGICCSTSPQAISSRPPKGPLPSDDMQKGTNSSCPLSEENEFQAMRREMGEYMAEMRVFRCEMAELRSSLTGMVQRLDGFEQRLSKLEQRETTSGLDEIAELEGVVTQLKLDLNVRDQEALSTDLDIGGLNEESGENVVHTITILASKLGVKLENQDIVYAERVGMGTSLNTAESGIDETRRRTRRVVVRLARRQLRDELLHAARVRRNLTTTDIGLGGASQRVYVNERLTRTNRLLFHRVREECHKRKWRYAWTKRGRIFARQTDGGRAHIIRSDNDFNRVFNVVAV